MLKFIYILIFLSLQIISLGQKFVPQNGKVLLFIGQDLGAIGGFDTPNNNGYYENVGVVSAGITTYTGLPGLSGLRGKANWGAGDVCAQDIIDNPIYNTTAIAIGLDIVGKTDLIANGSYDGTIRSLGTWIRESQRPVFLRIGYEFDGEWNNYDPNSYIKAFRRIVTVLREEYVSNVATVWQSTGRFDRNKLMSWYPGSDYVDWLGYSHFDNFGEGILDIAREKNKPVMIAEATPRRDLKTGSADVHWNAWFQPFFDHIHTNSDVIKAVAYINVNWDEQDMWSGQGWGDSRVEVNTEIKRKWLEEITSEKWINQADDVYSAIDYDPKSIPTSTEKNQSSTKVFVANDQINIQFNEAINTNLQLELFDTSGKLWMQKTIKHLAQGSSETLSTASLKEGIYFLKAQSGDRIYSFKILIQ